MTIIWEGKKKRAGFLDFQEERGTSVKLFGKSFIYLFILLFVAINVKTIFILLQIEENK